MKYCHTDILEKGLNCFFDPAVTAYEYHVCKDAPLSHADLANFSLGHTLIDPSTDLALQSFGTGNLNRKVVIKSSNLTIALTEDGEANHFAIADATDPNNKRILYVTPIIAPQQVLHGNELTSADWEIQLCQPE